MKQTITDSLSVRTSESSDVEDGESDLGRFRQSLLLVAILAALGVVVRGTPSPVSWLIHFLFAFALTLLVYRNLLNRSHTKLVIVAMIMLMIMWEIFEWFVQGTRVSDSLLLTGVDTALDLVCGFAGAVVAIRVSNSFGWM